MADDRKDDDLLFREIEEDLRRDQASQVWKKYSALIIGGVIVIIAATAGVVAWRDNQRGVAEQDGDRYVAAAALARDGKTDEALAAFDTLGKEGAAGYRTLARLQEAALLANKGDVEGAVAVYDGLAADGGVDKVFRDLAALLGAMASLDSADPGALTGRLQPLTADDNPWRYSALELTALVAERSGNRKQARDIFTRLSDDAAAPGGIRARARQMLESSGSREPMILTLSPRLQCVALLVLTLALPGCESLNPFSEKPPPPLPGERFPVLQYQQNVTADPRLADLSVELPRPEANPAWPQAGGYPSHDMGHLALGADPAVAWSTSIGSGSSKSRRLLAQPVVAEGRIYTMDARAEVGAFDAQNGSEIWSKAALPREEEDGELGGGIAFDSGRLYVSTGAAEVIAFDAANGQEIWRTPLPAPVHSAPTVSGGRVFVVTVENELHALNQDDGRKLWFHAGLAESAGFLGGASPAVDQGIVAVPHSSGELFALRVENGRPIWSDALASVQRVTAVAALADIRGQPVIDRGLVFAISNSGRMAAIDIRTGNRVWDVELGGLQTPWVAGDYVYVLTNNGVVVCLRRDSGRIRWATALDPYMDEDERKEGVFWTGPVLAGDRLIVAGSHGEALSISPYTGKVLGWIKLNRGVMIAPVVANSTLYVLDDGGRLTAMR